MCGVGNLLDRDSRVILGSMAKFIRRGSLFILAELIGSWSLHKSWSYHDMHTAIDFEFLKEQQIISLLMLSGDKHVQQSNLRIMHFELWVNVSLCFFNQFNHMYSMYVLLT